MQGAALLASGLSEDTVADMVLRRGLSDEQWEQIKPGETNDIPF